MVLSPQEFSKQIASSDMYLLILFASVVFIPAAFVFSRYFLEFNGRLHGVIVPFVEEFLKIHWIDYVAIHGLD